MEEYKPKKDRNCRFCEKLFDCTGKDPRVALCIQFKERKRELTEEKKDGIAGQGE